MAGCLDEIRPPTNKRSRVSCGKRCVTQRGMRNRQARLTSSTRVTVGLRCTSYCAQLGLGVQDSEVHATVWGWAIVTEMDAKKGHDPVVK